MGLFSLVIVFELKSILQLGFFFRPVNIGSFRSAITSHTLAPYTFTHFDRFDKRSTTKSLKDMVSTQVKQKHFQKHHYNIKYKGLENVKFIGICQTKLNNRVSSQICHEEMNYAQTSVRLVQTNPWRIEFIQSIR